ncbi:DUF637 domain-containing protein, partial [Klebsiella pneumoniae]|uniref:DUF637 domain-containing protein n=1 Tax=Klebsiella pneumoniae TaxID=573 RepID=UPI003B5CC37B
YAIGGITAGLTVGVVDKAWGIDTEAAKLSNKGFDLKSWSDVGKFAGYSATNATVNAGVTTAVRGGSFKDNLQSALIGEAQT